MESLQGLNIEPANPPIKPIIEYDPRLQGKDVPYTINVNSAKCVELFRELGISDEAIKKFKIKLEKGEATKGLGSYSYTNGGLITINTDRLWQYYKEHKVRINRIIKTDEGNDPNSTTLYLEKIKPSVVGVFLHESKHASDLKGKVAKVLVPGFQVAYYVGGVIGVGIAIYKSIPMVPINHLLTPLAVFSLLVLYAVHPLEIRARRFAAKNRDEVKWQDIMTITPKQKQA